MSEDAGPSFVDEAVCVSLASAWACTEWRNVQGSVRLAWPAPPATTFWELELFMEGWRQAVRTGEDALTLGFAWLSSGLALVERREPLTTTSLLEPPTDGDWSKMFARMGEVANRLGLANIDERFQARARRWLFDAAVFLMPEGFGHMTRGPIGELDAFVATHRTRLRALRSARLRSLLKGGFGTAVEGFCRRSGSALEGLILPFTEIDQEDLSSRAR